MKRRLIFLYVVCLAIGASLWLTLDAPFLTVSIITIAYALSGYIAGEIFNEERN